MAPTVNFITLISGFSLRACQGAALRRCSGAV